MLNVIHSHSSSAISRPQYTTGSLVTKYTTTASLSHQEDVTVVEIFWLEAILQFLPSLFSGFLSPIFQIPEKDEKFISFQNAPKWDLFYRNLENQGWGIYFKVSSVLFLISFSKILLKLQVQLQLVWKSNFLNFYTELQLSDSSDYFWFWSSHLFLLFSQKGSTCTVGTYLGIKILAIISIATTVIALDRALTSNLFVLCCSSVGTLS